MSEIRSERHSLSQPQIRSPGPQIADPLNVQAVATAGAVGTPTRLGSQRQYVMERQIPACQDPVRP